MHEVLVKDSSRQQMAERLQHQNRSRMYCLTVICSCMTENIQRNSKNLTMLLVGKLQVI